jgi:hypothetical protein
MRWEPAGWGYGQHFPDSDPRWRSADGGQFVTHAVAELARGGWSVVNADLTLIAQSPASTSCGRRSAQCGASDWLGCRLWNIKATTTENWDSGAFGRPGRTGRGADYPLARRSPRWPDLRASGTGMAPGRIHFNALANAGTATRRR